MPEVTKSLDQQQHEKLITVLAAIEVQLKRVANALEAANLKQK